MNLFKKATATLALLGLLSWIFTTGVSAASTAEIDAANYLAKAGIIVDHTDNPAAYNLDQNVLRQEIAAVSRGIAGLDKKTTCDGVFKDVSATKPNDWACYTVEQLADNGLIALNENFRPEDNISKAEGVGMIVKASFGDEYMYDPTLTTTWQEQVVAFAVKKGVVENFTNYDTPATRGFVFLAWANAMEATKDSGTTDIDKIMCELLGICDENTGGDNNQGGTDGEKPVVTTGSFEITLNPKSPVAQTIPRSGLIPFGKFDVAAGKEDIKIDSITLKREGLSQRTDIRRVYFEKNGVRISNRASVGIDELANVSFTPALTVKAGSTETIDLVVELKETGDGATIGAEHRFAISEAADVEASATVGGAFPLRTALMRVGSYVVEQVRISPVGTSSTQNVGQENALLTEFQLQTKGDRDNLFKSITLRNAWDADAGASLTNIWIYKEGKKVSSEVSISGRDVTVYVNDTILNGRSENYQLRADISWAERTRETYEFELRNTSDLTVVEKESGFSAPVLIDLAGEKKWPIVTVEWGDFLISRDTAYTLNQTVSAATNDVVLYAAKVNVKEEVSVEDVAVTMTFLGLPAKGKLEQFSSLRFLVGGSTVATYTPTTGEDGEFLFESNFNIRAGQTTMKITWNIKADDNIDGAQYRIDKVQLGGTSGEIRYVSNDEKVTPNGSAQGIATTVKDGDLAFTRNDGIDNYTIVPGTSDKLVLGFSARANDVSDIKITGMKFTMTDANTSVSSSLISNIRLYQDGKLVPNGTKNNFDFNSLDITLKKNTSTNFEVMADFANSIEIDKTFQLNLDTNGVNARNLDSNKAVTPTAKVTSAPFTFQDWGKLKLTSNSSQVQASILTPSTSESSVFKFDLEADDDNVMVTDILVENVALTGSTAGVVSLKDAVRTSSLYINGKSYPGTIEWNLLHFSIGSNGVIVKSNQTMTWDVRLAFHDSQSRSNVSLQLAIKDGTSWDVTGAVNGIRALSESTGKEITRTGGTISSNGHILGRSKPTVAKVDFSRSTSDIYKFTVTADANRKITIDEIGLRMGGSATFNNGTMTIYRDSESAGNVMYVKYLGTGAVSDSTLTDAGGFTSWSSSTLTVGGTEVVTGDKFQVVYWSQAWFTWGTATVVATYGDNGNTIATKLATAINDNVPSVTAVASGNQVNVTLKAEATAKPASVDTTGTTQASGGDATKPTGWIAGPASKEISAGTTVTFYAKLDSTSPNKDNNRETNITTFKYHDDLSDVAPVIEASPYNAGLPTTVDSYKY